MVWLKRLNNSDSGDATHLGGNQWDFLDQYHDNTDISASLTNPTVINTATTYRDEKLLIRNLANTFSYSLKAGTLTANVDVSLPNASGDITLIGAGTTNDWGTAMQTFRNSNLKIMNPANTFGYIFNTSAIVANRNVTLPLLTADDTLVTNTFTATLTNKNINIDSNTLKHSTTNAQGDIYKYDSVSGKIIRGPRGTTGHVLKSTATDIEWAAESGGAGSADADKVKVYEGGVLVGTVARKLNFNATDFNVSADLVNDEIDVVLASPGGGGTGNTTTIYKNTTTVSVSNTTTETNLLNTSVGAGEMSTNNILHITLSGWILNDGGNADGFTFRLKFGGVTLWEDETEDFSDATNRRPLHMEFWIKNVNSASAQRTTGTYLIGNEANMHSWLL